MSGPGGRQIWPLLMAAALLLAGCGSDGYFGLSKRAKRNRIQLQATSARRFRAQFTALGNNPIAGRAIPPDIAH